MESSGPRRSGTSPAICGHVWCSQAPALTALSLSDCPLEFLDSEGQEGAQKGTNPAVLRGPHHHIPGFPLLFPVSGCLVSATEQLSRGPSVPPSNEATYIHVKTAPRATQCKDPSQAVNG